MSDREGTCIGVDHAARTLSSGQERRWRNSLRYVLLSELLSVAYLLAPAFSIAASQEVGSTGAVRSAVATAIRSEITVDGFLAEPVWETGPTIGGLIQREPRNGEPPTEQTEVRLLYDADYLYIGVICFDSEPDRVIGTVMTRDANLNSDDRIEIVLDTYRDQSNAFYFATNAAGALVDGLVFANGQTNTDWDAVWDVRTRRTEEGWTAEFAIPFKSLSFPPGQRVWGFNIGRYIQRKLEDVRWSGARLEVGFFQVSEAGEINSLEGITQGRGLDVRPFLGGRWLHTSANGNDTITGKPGLDISYNVNSSLKLTATLNTDFGETEVDARQINLSRFSLFFPEKRAFFLEDAGVFNFSNSAVRQLAWLAPTRAEVIPFFSRRIGLIAGEEVPIDAGVKVTGKVGRTDLGVLSVRTRDVGNVQEKNFFVGRIKRNLLEQSSVGAILVSGHPSLPIDSNTFGTDVRLATSEFLDRKNLEFNAYVLKSQNEGISDNDLSYGFSLQYPNDTVELELISREIQDDFRPALGFVGRKNVRVLRAGGRFNPRPQDFVGLQQFFLGGFYNRFIGLDDGEVESWDLVLMTIDFHFRSGDSLHNVFSPHFMFERLSAPFEIFPGVVIPPGEYRFTRWTNHVATAPRRRLSGSVQWVMGTYWSGHADELRTTLTYKYPPNFTLGLSTNFTWARLPQGNFATRIMGANVDYSVSPFLSFTNLIQYDNQSRNLGWQSRVRWTLRPGNDLFFVFNQGWIQDDAGGYRFSAEESKVSTKFQYTFRF